MIQLRVRTEYTFGQTYAPLPRVIDRLKALGVRAAGIVDRGSTWGHVRWFNECKKAGIQPLLGVELIVADEDDAQTAMWFLAANDAGLKEIYHMATAAHRDCVKTRRGELPRLRRNRVVKASENVFKFAGDIVDGEFLADCNAILDLSPASRILNARKRAIAEEHGLRVVDVSDNSYAFLEDRPLFELMADRGMKPTPQHIIEVPDSPVAEEIVASASAIKLPVAPMVRAEGDIEALCRAGIAFRKMEGKWNAQYEARLQHELKLIREKDFESYFLVVADMCHYAKQHMLVGPSRGSAAGSLACYLMRITEIDPIPPKLFFERFIDVSRSDLPDIDLDFPDNKRHMVFEYMAQKYGAEKVAHIGTVTTFKPKSALVHVCKKMNIPPAATAAVKVAMIERSSADSRANNCLQDTLETTEPGKQLVQMYPEVVMSAALEGHATHTGVHAAGLLVANVDLQDYATIDNNGIAQIEKGAAEALGLLKIDVLGLRTLGILEDSGVNVDWYAMEFNDQKTYDVFNRQLLSSIFQFEGNAMKAVSRQIIYSSLTDIDAVTALARPGPFGGGVTKEYLERRAGKGYESLHPLVEEHMSETFGLPIYQEQTLAIVREIGKFDWKETSTIRKAMSKRMGKEFFDSMWERFKAGATSQGIPEHKARQTWELINAMGAWQMNKAHTYSYAVISYWTAWLKANHPLEFAAANLRNAKDDEGALRLLRELVNEGLHYVPFDPLVSDETWAAKDGKLIAGYGTLHGFGEAKARKFVAARKAGALTQKMIDEARRAPSAFHNIFPVQSKYADWYNNPEANGIAGKLWRIKDIDGTQSGSVVFIGKLVKKNARNSNEDVNVKKRGGKILRGPVDFLDITLDDDTGIVQSRIDRFKYQRMGKEILDKVPIGATLMVRADFKDGIRFGFVTRWKRIDNAA